MSGVSRPLQTLNKARWTPLQDYAIVLIGTQIQREKDITQETMDWFIPFLWPGSLSLASTAHYDMPSPSIIGNGIKPQTRPEIRKAFVQRVLGVTKINDSILDWLHAAVFGTGKIASPSFNNGGSFSSFGSDEDDSDTGDDETLENNTIGDESPYQYGEYCPTPSICGPEDSEPADSEKENEGSLQPAASFDIWDSRSTTRNHKTLDTAAALTAENAGRDLEAAHSLSQLMQSEVPAAAEPPSEIAGNLSDESMPSELLTSVAKRRLSHSDGSDDDEE
ncbi:hypothetical protein GGR57DRAFT_477022 [Xylariaceae sp. FL1272]|nr:hypothetical protein GGR57DRAFT_477022 [Xylariaceae sp. FL1272]